MAAPERRPTKAVYYVDAALTILYASAALIAMVGGRPLIGRTMQQAFPEVHSRAWSVYRQALATGEAMTYDWSSDLNVGIDAPDLPAHVEVTLTPVTTGGVVRGLLVEVQPSTGYGLGVTQALYGVRSEVAAVARSEGLRMASALGHRGPRVAPPPPLPGRPAPPLA